MEKIYSDKGVSFGVDFENTGNIHFSPKGKISIFYKNGKKLEKIFLTKNEKGEKVFLNDIPVNLFQNYTLPGMDRVYVSDWKENLKEGVFDAKLEFVYKKNNRAETFKENLKLDVQDDLEVLKSDLAEEDGKTYFILKLKNKGTVYEKLKGGVEVLNNLDYKIGEIKIPGSIEYVTPGQEKEFKILFLNKKMPEGDYVLKSNIHYGVSGKKLEINKSFNFSSNWFLYIGIGLLVLFGFYLWRKKKTKKIGLEVKE